MPFIRIIFRWCLGAAETAEPQYVFPPKPCSWNVCAYVAAAVAAGGRGSRGSRGSMSEDISCADGAAERLFVRSREQSVHARAQHLLSLEEQ